MLPLRLWRENSPKLKWILAEFEFEWILTEL